MLSWAKKQPHPDPYRQSADDYVSWRISALAQEISWFEMQEEWFAWQ